MGFLSSLIYFIIAIGILVFVHEFGHFICARLSKMRVDVFALGMGSRLFGWNKKLGFTFGKLPKDFDGEGKTDYRVSILPIGGYVKIEGMVDESLDSNYSQEEPQPWEFRAKNPFQKFITISGGVLMNLIFAALVFAFITQIQGKDYWATTTVGAVRDSSVGAQIGLQPNDKIIEISGKEINDWDEFLRTLSLENIGEQKTIKAIRNGKRITLKADGKKIIKQLSDKKSIGIFPNNLKTYLTTVLSLKPAGKIGLKKGDTIVSVNGKRITATTQFQKIVKANAETPLFLKWKRGNKTMSDSIKPTSEGMIGVGISQAYTGPVTHEEFGLFASLASGAKQTYKTITLIIDSVAQMFEGNIGVKQSVGGPIAIAQMASQEAQRGLLNFFNFLALLSVMLAVINILPFPALDGGHLVIILIEAVIRRELPLKLKLAIQQVGMVILVLLMIFVFYIDLTR